MIDCSVDEVGKHIGGLVRLRGWLYSRRSGGKLQFLLLRDGTGIIQAVVSRREVPEETFKLAEEITQESSLALVGTIRADERAPGGYEMLVQGAELYQAAGEYPISPKEHGVSFLMDHRHLWLRSTRPHAVLKIRSRVIRACRDFLDGRGFLLVDAPVLTPAACEGTTTLFATDYYGDQAYLTQSGQLYNEATAAAFGRVYCFGPTFRAEKSKTRKHLSEFWMVEPEWNFADLDAVMSLTEEMICYLVEEVLKHHREDLKVLERDTTPLEEIRTPFPRLSYDDALEILKRKNIPLDWGEDFGAPHESALSEEYARPLFVHRFPAKTRAFYMRPDPENEALVLGVDLLAPEGYGEIVGGGERLSDLELLEARIKEHDLPRESFEWYIDLRRFGSVPHAGFGMGIERVVAWLAGLDHLREAIPFPRTLKRIYP